MKHTMHRSKFFETVNESNYTQIIEKISHRNHFVHVILIGWNEMYKCSSQTLANSVRIKRLQRKQPMQQYSVKQ